MRAIILAAGSGLRLGQHTKDIPKALLDINGKSILERQISLLRQHGINEIFVVTGYQREKPINLPQIYAGFRESRIDLSTFGDCYYFSTSKSLNSRFWNTYFVLPEIIIIENIDNQWNISILRHNCSSF